MESNMESNMTNISLTTASSPPPVDYVGYVAVPLLLVVGVLGNLLTALVMRSKPFSRAASSYLLLCLALSDTVVNVLLPFNKGWVHELLGTDIRSHSETSCQAFYWAFRTAKMTSSWMVVLVCLERFVAVCFPSKAPTLCKKSFAVLSISLVYGSIGVYNGVWVTFADHIVNGVCRPNTQPEGLVKINRTLLVVGLSIYSFLPCVILVVLTSLIIAQLHKGRDIHQRARMLEARTKVKDPTVKMTAMLLCVIIAFIILVLPISFAHLIFFVKRKPIFASMDPGVVIFREVATILEQANYSINFFLYIVACPSFRKHLPKLFCCKKRQQKGGISENDLISSSSSECSSDVRHSIPVITSIVNKPDSHIYHIAH